jgi:glycosyltransferase involved in cell wall biosynthesis
MARRGWRVLVYTSAVGYEDTSLRFPRREILDGVDVRRLPFSSFGKTSVLARLLGGTIFLVQAILRSLFVRETRQILISTSPPMCSIAGLILGRVKGAEVSYWAMDINPDQLVAMGSIDAKAWAVRAFDGLNARILKQSWRIVALDRYMSETLSSKYPVADKTRIIPPWPHLDQTSKPLPHEKNPFRRQHGLEDHFVVMYSGNLSLAHPVDTILEAADRLRNVKQLLFLFIGGGNGRQSLSDFIAERRLPNVKMLPYQPLSELHYSLSSADVHLVAMGEPMVGIVHPCKIYGAMAVGRPVLFLGPEQCHAGDILNEFDIGWHIEHGDTDGAVAALTEMLSTTREKMELLGENAMRAASDKFSKARLLSQFCDVLDEAGEPSHVPQACASATRCTDEK